jgi:polysaccharide deacetylase 2 family uncharacterized protein YibQ
VSVLAVFLSVASAAASINFLRSLPEGLEALSGAALYDTDIESRSDDSPKVAIVLDDCGANLDMALRVLAFKIPMTWAIIPNLKFSVKTAEILSVTRTPFLVHVPMQAEIDPPGHAGNHGSYYIGAGMDADEVRNALAPLLDSLEGAFGINNHRGSKATADRNVMNYVMEELAERRMFFFDSRTSARSIAYETALKHGLDAAFNSRFLDNEPDRGKIAAQMASVLSSVKSGDFRAVICHLRPETVEFLEEFAKEVSVGTHKSGVKLVTLPKWIKYAKGDIKDEKCGTGSDWSAVGR